MRYIVTEDAKFLIRAQAELSRVGYEYYYRHYMLPRMRSGKTPNGFFEEQISDKITRLMTVHGAALCKVPMDRLKEAIVNGIADSMYGKISPSTFRYNSKQDTIISLLKMCATINDIYDSITTTHIELDLPSPFDEALDLLGVPCDATVDKETREQCNDGFCRDWLLEKWLDNKEMRQNPLLFIEWVRNELKEGQLLET